jgi:hypothetical protein
MSDSIIGDVLSLDVQPAKFDDNNQGSSSAALASIDNALPAIEGDVDVKMIIHASNVPEELWTGLNELVDHSLRKDIEIVTDREQEEHIQTDGEYDWLIRFVRRALPPPWLPTYPDPSPRVIPKLFLCLDVGLSPWCWPFSLVSHPESQSDAHCKGRRKERKGEESRRGAREGLISLHKTS